MDVVMELVAIFVPCFGDLRSQVATAHPSSIILDDSLLRLPQRLSRSVYALER